MQREIEITFDRAMQQARKNAKQGSYHFNYAEQAVEGSTIRESALLSIAASLAYISHSLILMMGGTTDER